MKWLKMLLVIIFFFGLVLVAVKVAQVVVTFTLVTLVIGITWWRCRS